MKPKPQEGIIRQQCTSCKCWLEMDLFYKHLHTKGGYRKQCKKCWNKVARKNYKQRSDGSSCGKRTYAPTGIDLVARQILETNAFWTENIKETL